MIRYPEPLRPYPPPPGAAAAVIAGSAPIRQVFTAAQQLKVLRTNAVLVVGFLVVGGAAQTTAYLVDTNNDNMPAAAIIDARKAPAVAPALLTDGWFAPDPRVAPRMYKGLAVIADQADAEVFVYILE